MPLHRPPEQLLAALDAVLSDTNSSSSGHIPESHSTVSRLQREESPSEKRIAHIRQKKRKRSRREDGSIDQDSGGTQPSNSKRPRSKKKHKKERQRKKTRRSPLTEDFRKGLQHQIDFARSGRLVRTGVQDWSAEEFKEGAEQNPYCKLRAPLTTRP
jgi:hypothetical protein